MKLATYTINEVAELCKCSDDTIRKAIHSLELTASLIGRAYVIKEVDLNAYLDSKSLANIKANECHSTSEAQFGGLKSLSMGSRLDNLLAQKTNEKHNRSTTNLKVVQTSKQAIT